ncbi:flagellar hook-length control protein FliK [Butyrivibrio sp. XPD2006]|uniref:flagellar hook-length control protein FliK n=1 Tax=Butyrivibrio sp. XPD2006 TaxID=1280668 RepID=UPI0003B431DF|nr:flagellar hook-length control protein FliK [Butyrivibrio sp. XPD2006]
MNVISNVSQQNTVIIDGSRFTDQKAAEKPLDLRTGSTIQGTVVSVSQGEGGERLATISVGNNVINAKLSDEMGLREGQTLNFSVRSNGASGVTITPLYENTSIDQSTLKALTAAGIEINNDTVQMVKDMMEAGLPIGKDALLEMNKNLSANPNTSISTMVEMKSLGIPINENNIVQFESYKNYEHQVTSAMEDIMNELPDAFSELTASGNDKAALDLYGSVLKLFSGEEITSGQETVSVTQEAAGAQNTNALAEATEESLINPEITEEIAKESSEGNSPVQNGSTIQNEDAKAQNDAALQGKNILSDSFVNDLKKLGIPEETIKNYENALKEVSKNPEGATSEATARLETAQKELLKELSSAFESSDTSTQTSADAWKSVFSKDEFTKLLKDNISSQWHIKPGEVEKKENIENLYQRLGNQVKGLTSAIEQNLGAESKLGQTANNLQNNLNFMDQLNHMFQYVQLPLQMTGQNVHGDLYVYRNKHKKMTDDGSVSAVLHLDMEHLGPLDVYVKMKDNKVATNFYVADDSILDLINDNIHILNERLEKRGYTMSVKMMLHDEMDGQDAAVDEMLDVMKTPILSTASFDARA